MASREAHIWCPISALVLLACHASIVGPAGGAPDSGSSGGPEPDAGSLSDAGPAPDAGARPDGGTGVHHTIQIYAYYFADPANPQAVTNLTTTIASGDTVDWVWMSDFTPQTLGSCNVVSPSETYPPANLYDCVSMPSPSPLLDSGQQYYPFTYSHTFLEGPGQYPYVCQDHCGDSTDMWGTIVVQ